MFIRLIEVFVNLISFFFWIDSFVLVERHFSNRVPGVEKMLRQVWLVVVLVNERMRSSDVMAGLLITMEHVTIAKSRRVTMKQTLIT